MSLWTALIFVWLAASSASASEYRSGVAVADSPRPSVLAIERGRLERVLIMTLDASGLPNSFPDVIAARVMKRYGLERGALLLNFRQTDAAAPATSEQALVDLAGKALDAMQQVSDMAAELCGPRFLNQPCPVIHGRIRSALQIAEVGALSFSGKRSFYPVQAISFGRSLTVLALAGDVPADYRERLKREFPDANLIVMGNSNAVMSWSDDIADRILPTVRAVIKRVR